MPARPRPPAASPLEGIERALVDGNNLLGALRRDGVGIAPAALVGRLRAVIELPIRIELLFDGPPDPGMRDTRIASGVTVRHSGRMTADAVLIGLVREAQDPGAVLVITNDVELRREIMRRGGRTASATWLVGRLEKGRLEGPRMPIARPTEAVAIRPSGARPAPNRPPSPRLAAGDGARRSTRSTRSPNAAAAPPRTGPIPRLDPADPKPRTGPIPRLTAPAAPPADAQSSLRALGADPTKDDQPDGSGWQPGRGATAKKGNPHRSPRTARTQRPPGTPRPPR